MSAAVVLLSAVAIALLVLEEIRDARRFNDAPSDEHARREALDAAFRCTLYRHYKREG